MCTGLFLNFFHLLFVFGLSHAAIQKTAGFVKQLFQIQEVRINV